MVTSTSQLSNVSCYPDDRKVGPLPKEPFAAANRYSFAVCQPSQPSLPMLSRGSAEAATTGSVGDASATSTSPLHDPSVSFLFLCFPHQACVSKGVIRHHRALRILPHNNPTRWSNLTHHVTHSLVPFPQQSYDDAQKLKDKVVRDWLSPEETDIETIASKTKRGCGSQASL